MSAVMTPASIATAMLERFAVVPWGHGGTGSKADCVLQCAGKVRVDNSSLAARHAAAADRIRFYAEFALAAGIPANGDVMLAIARWNDADGRVFADVEAPLKRIAGVA